MDSSARKILSPNEQQMDSDPAGIVFRPTCELYDEYEDAARVPCVPFMNMGGKKEFCGVAVTVKCFEDNSRVKELLFDINGKGKVLVVDGGGSQRVALLGDMIAEKAVDNQWEGIIINGNVRDVGALRKLNLGIMALGATPRKSVRRGEGQVDLPVRIGDVWCMPGDRVYADEDGVLIVD
jgi:regulator of ribonuclease activity A